MGSSTVYLVLLSPAYFADPQSSELKKTHKQAVREERREKRKNKVPKHVKKRKDKVWKQKHGGK